MTAADAGPRRVELDPEVPCCHLVVKRGHRGRYRFTMIHDGVRMSGDLMVPGAERAGPALDAQALELLSRAAAALVDALVRTRVRP